MSAECSFDFDEDDCLTHTSPLAQICRHAAAALRAKAETAQLALESLTPGGSEYVGDPQRCVAYVRETSHSQHAAIVKFKQERDAFQRRAEGAERQLDAYIAVRAEERTRLAALEAQLEEAKQHVKAMQETKSGEVASLEARNAALSSALRRLLPLPPSSPHEAQCGCSYCEAVAALATRAGEEK